MQIPFFISEDFLHYVWKHKLFNLQNLTTEDGQLLQILNEGMHNHESGPDFSNAKIQIGNLTWAGNVEVHINSSDWFAHNHQNDPVYQKAILHVVWNNNKQVFDNLNNPIPTLVLNGRVSSSLLAKYDKLILNRNEIMCSDSIPSVNKFEFFSWLNRLLIERLEVKTSALQEIYSRTKGNWEQTFFIVFCKNFGFKTNQEGMMALSRNLDFKILLKNKDDLFKLESLLFGVAGFLGQEFKEEYPINLQKEYRHQKHKYNLEEIPVEFWKFGRIRPSGFPTIRLSQLANLIHIQGNLFDAYVRNIPASLDVIQSVEVSTYWNTHFTFLNPGQVKKKSLGKSAVQNLLINTVAPMMFFYGQETGSLEFRDKALDLLEKLPAENNFIIRNWAQNNIFADNAFESQSLIQLTNNYCTLKKCLNCGIGNQVLKHEVG